MKLTGIIFLFSTFLLSNNIFSQNIKDTILIDKNNSPYIVSKDLIIPSKTLFLVNKSAEIIVSDSVNIIVFGKLFINGTRKNPVSIKSVSNSSSWGRIRINSKQKNIIRYANFINGAITAKNSRLYVSNSKFYYFSSRNFDGYPVFFIHNSKTNFFNNTLINYTNRYVGEGINFIGGTTNCVNNYIKDMPDAIEFTRIVIK